MLWCEALLYIDGRQFQQNIKEMSVQSFFVSLKGIIVLLQSHSDGNVHQT